MPESPPQLLERALKQEVRLRLKDDREITGRLLGLDEHLNLVLDEVQERVHDTTRRLGTIVLRGSNVVTLHVSGPPGGGRQK